MESVWIGVVASLGGVALGLLGNLGIQALSYRRESRERLQVARRASYLSWLARVQEQFDAIGSVHRALGRNEIDNREASDRLRRLSPVAGQTALEDVRLVAGEAVAVSAAAVWGHMRNRRVALGRELDAKEYRRWSNDYWQVRRAFLDCAREESGLRPLDWSKASVTSNPAPKKLASAEGSDPDSRSGGA